MTRFQKHLEVRQTASVGSPDIILQEIAVNIYIYLFLLFGAVFGLSTFSFKHFFSEGPHQVDTDEGGAHLADRVLWAMVCTFLWPIMLLTGLNSARILAKRKRLAMAAKN